MLAPGGVLMATFCLVDDMTLARVARGEAHIDLRHPVRDASGVEYHTLDPASPETAIGYREAHVRATLARAGLTVSAIYPGTWSGSGDGFTFQDVVIARRGPAPARARAA